MKYAIYDKAADGYLTKMEFEVGYSEHTQFECGYNEYITEAQLLDTPKEAADAIARIESFKFMEKGRFVMHSFDDTLKDQYIISEAGTPTKVVDNITVDLDGTINVKYGTMACHWSATLLEYAVNRMNALQKAISPKYAAWHNTFDIYRVISIIDERSCGHYQFIKVTEKGLVKYAKKEVDPLNKRIEELEEENDKLKAKVESIKKEAHHWKTMYESAAESRELLKDTNDIACTKRLANAIIDICEVTTDPFEVTLKKFSQLYEAIWIPGNNDDAITHAFKSLLLIFSKVDSNLENVVSENVAWKNKAQKTEKALNDQKKKNDANKATIAQMVVEKRAMDKELSDAADALKEVNDKNDALSDMLGEITDGVADIMLATRTVDNDKMISDLTDVSLKIGVKTVDDGPIYGISVILNILIRKIKEAIEWKSRTEEVICRYKAKDKDYEMLKNKLEACEVVLDSTHDLLTKTTEERDKAMNYCINDVKSTTEIRKLVSIRDSLAEVIFAIRNAICNNDSEAFRCIENRMKFDSDFNSDPFMAGVSENIKDICAAEKKNIANHELKNSEISKLAKEITDWKRRAEEAIRDYTKCNEALGEWKKKCRAKDADYEVLKNKLKACEIILESTQSSLTATIKERDKALERAENFKGIANSVYGITIPGRCCGKQITADVITGKKILIDKKKYDDLLECVNNISLTYEMMKIIPFSMDLPSWLGGIINRIEDLTK